MGDSASNYQDTDNVTEINAGADIYYFWEKKYISANF